AIALAPMWALFVGSATDSTVTRGVFPAGPARRSTVSVLALVSALALMRASREGFGGAWWLSPTGAGGLTRCTARVSAVPERVSRPAWCAWWQLEQARIRLDASWLPPSARCTR